MSAKTLTPDPPQAFPDRLQLLPFAVQLLIRRLELRLATFQCLHPFLQLLPLLAEDLRVRHHLLALLIEVPRALLEPAFLRLEGPLDLSQTFRPRPDLFLPLPEPTLDVVPPPPPPPLPRPPPRPPPLRF